MTTLEIILRVAVIAVLCACWASHHRRRVRETPLPPEDPSVWTGHGIDTRTLRPRLDHLRDDYRGATRTAPPLPETVRRRAWTRHMISCLAYFRRRHDPDDREHGMA